MTLIVLFVSVITETLGAGNPHGLLRSPLVRTSPDLFTSQSIDSHWFAIVPSTWIGLVRWARRGFSCRILLLHTVHGAMGFVWN